jgi:lysophospholipase L1-like esterase
MILIAIVLSIFGNIFFVLYQMKRMGLFSRTRNTSQWWKYKLKQFEVFPVTANDTVCLGDSHFELFPLADAFPGQRIRNRGIGGNTAGDLLNRLDELFVADPKVVLIQIGTNDLRKAKPLTAGQTSADIEELVLRLKAKTHTHLILQSVLPSNKGVDPHQIISLNRQIEALALKHHTGFYDLHARFVDDKLGLLRKYDSGDGVHLNADGYRYWASLMPEILLGKSL